MKQQVAILDAVPSKRLFLSIIADYDLNKSICELVDNAFDMWTRSGRTRAVTVEVWLRESEGMIVIQDDAGGIAREDLRFVVGPGQSSSGPTDQTIGIFGVGTKRAVVALANDIRIATRRRNAETYQVEFNDDWLNDEDWALPLFRVADIEQGVTRVELRQLRPPISRIQAAQLREHLGATYAKFLAMPGVTLRLDDERVAPRLFDGWSYPPNYGPRRYSGSLLTESGREVELDVTAGLSNESSPASGAYGVYFYCNDRLVAPAMKSFDVGFTRGQAGLPHPKISLTKVIVSMRGDADAMPWNSSKSDISTKHQVFVALHAWLVKVVSDYARLSRTWMGEWPEKVFAYPEGEIEEHPIAESIAANRSFLPDPPPSRPRLPQRVAKRNQALARRNPWVVPLYEGVVAAVGLVKQPLEHANWLALNLLHVTLTAAIKEYVLRAADEEITNKDLRTLLSSSSVDARLRSLVPLGDVRWSEIEVLRGRIDDLTYSRTTPNVGINELLQAEALVRKVLKSLFRIETEA